MEEATMLERYRRDRRKLLEFLLSSSSGLIKEFQTPAGPTTSLSGINLDTLSSDYVLQTLNSGGVVNISEATKKYFDESSYPFMVYSKLGSSYFLLSDPDLAGSPPRRPPPPVDVNQTTNCASCSSRKWEDSILDNNVVFTDDLGHDFKSVDPLEDVGILSLGLPCLTTGIGSLMLSYVYIQGVMISMISKGLSDDDLQESAYEIFLASMAFSGIEIHEVEDKKKEKTPKFLSGLRNKKERTQQKPHSLERHAELFYIIRVQMQISEEMDLCIRQRLMQLSGRRAMEQIDIPQISLGLLSDISESDILNQKSYIRWKKRQGNILEELIGFSAQLEKHECLAIKSSFEMIRNAKEFDNMITPFRHAEVLSAIRKVTSKLSSLPGKFGAQGETYYWTAGYHLNIRLYEKLLLGLFDILDEGQFIEEADEILMLIKLTWSTLGISQKIHNMIYGWLLFKQFVATDESLLLEHAILELQKVLLSTEEDHGTDDLYLNSLVCSKHYNGSEITMTLMDAICFSISIWCVNKLQDYHLHFGEKPSSFRMVMSLVSAVGLLTSTDCGDTKLTRLNSLNGNVAGQLKTYVESSTKAAYRRIASTIDLESEVERTHPLALLANEVRLIAHRELNVFCPVLCCWCPDSGITAAILLHQFYGERLETFLRGVSHLSKDVKSVLAAANLLDHDLTKLFTYACEENRLHHPTNQSLKHYSIKEVAKPIILDWLIAQSAHNLEWTGRVFDLEEWEPLSFQQRQAASVVEVFRIIEETVDQFFGMDLPMDFSHLQALLSVIFHSLDAYLLKLLNQLVEKNHLYPSVPPLTRYKETTVPIMNKKLLESVLLDDNVSKKLNELTISKLCIRLNTLKYIQNQIRILEDSIRKSWEFVTSSVSHKFAKEGPLESLEKDSSTLNEAMDALFDTTFNIIMDVATNAINKICDFSGARVVFWDLRDAFLFSLYRGNVQDTHLDSVLPNLNNVLDLVCGLIDGDLRDYLVLSIYRASLEGFVWVLLDGGPYRAFSNSDILVIEDDLNMLMEFFVAGGEGLPRSLVKEQAKLAEHILSLYSLETATIIQMLMTASEQLSTASDSYSYGNMGINNDAQTLIRVLCHKKDKEASEFLKRLYQLPMSSEYDDTSSKNSAFRSPSISGILKRSTSVSKKRYSSFKSFKKKFQEASFEIRNIAW